MASDMPSKIDVHVHFLPPAYRQACLDHGHANPDGMPYLPEWSEEAHLELMDKNGIQKAILSISTPGTHLVYNDSELAAKVTRDCNSYAADLKKRMPDRFGYWASLPIPDVDLCLEEIAKSAEEGIALGQFAMFLISALAFTFPLALMSWLMKLRKLLAGA